MNKAEIIAPLYKSIVRRTSDLLEEMNATGKYPEVRYHDWESRGDENKLPQMTLIGVEAFGFEENGGLWIIRFGLGVSSFRDANLINEIEMISHLHTVIGEGCKVPLLNSLAELESELVVTEFQVLPMSASELRNYRTIGIELKRTGT